MPNPVKKPKRWLFFLFFSIVSVFDLSPLQAQNSLENGKNLYFQGEYAEAISQLKAAIYDKNSSLSADTYYYLGKAYHQIGQSYEAIVALKQAVAAYRQNSSLPSRRQLTSALLDLAQTHLELGQLREADTLATEAIALGEQLQDPRLRALAYGTQGNVLLRQNELEAALAAYQQSEKLARQSSQERLATIALNQLTQTSQHLAKYYQQQSQWSLEALDPDSARQWLKQSTSAQNQSHTYALQALELSQDLAETARVQAIVNFLPFSESSRGKTDYVNQALEILQKLPSTRSKIFLLVELASYADGPGKETILKQAVQEAQTLSDSRGLSFALGELGNWAEKQGHYQPALAYSRQAQLAAQETFDFDSLYQWQWQEGRLQAAIGEMELSKAAYRRALASLQPIRGSLAKTADDVQFDFKTQVEPVYRELLAILLEGGTQPEIEEAISVFQRFQIAELENYFQDICLEGQVPPVREYLARHQAASMMAIVLPSKTYLIWQGPDGKISHHPVPISQQELHQRIGQWRSVLEDPFSNEHLIQGQALYNLLIRPLEAQIQAASPKILLFVGDGLLRNVPMAALHDGQQFLVEKWAIANSLGFNLVVRDPPKSFSSLAFGLTVAVGQFPSLSNAAYEIELVNDVLGGEEFLNEEFTQENLNKQLQTQSSSVLHLTTHGKFGGTIERTFIQAYDSPIGLKDLERILVERKAPLELLTLSGCETASGNERSVLGLAGVALRAGVRSTVGSLWSVDDEQAAELLGNFYQNWQGDMTKAEALRQAQLKQIQNPQSRPYDWSSFVLYVN